MEIKQVGTKYRELILLLFYGVVIGGSVGVLDAIFGMVLLNITSFREDHVGWLLPFLGAVGIFIVFLYERYGQESKKGMSLVFEVGHGQREQIPLQLIPLVVISTWATHLFGGSAGREGVAVQIGATCSQWIGRTIFRKKGTNIFLVAGIAAGFSGLFGTPIAAILFAMEVLVTGALQYEALLLAISASFMASTTTAFLGLERFHVNLSTDISLTGKTFCILLVLGLVFGFVGFLFSYCLSKAKEKGKQWIVDDSKRIAIGGVLLSVILLLLHQGRYSGLGTNLIQASFDGTTIYWYDWILKLGLTVVTLAVGFQGGEVTPLFSIGASLGIIIAPFLGIPTTLGAALGYVAVFGSATNTFLAPVFIGAEVFGYEYIPYFFIVCAMAYGINGNHSIYPLQKQIY